MQPTLPGFAIFHELHHDAKHVIYRGIREKDQKPLLIKTFTSQHPRLEDVARLKGEFDLLKHIETPSIIKTYGLEEHQNNYFLLLEDTQDIPIEKLLRVKKLDLLDKLDLSIEITKALGELQSQEIIHKDIQPQNILVNPENFKVKLSGFNYATKIPRQRLSLKSPSAMEGNLSYISPEQTGRMNCEVDYRTDFYSLGVMLFKIFTDELPFKSYDAMELVYSHMAKAPPSPRDFNPELPQQIANIILKLLSKKAEERYSSSVSLLHDLEKCKEELKSTGKISLFPLAENDVFHKLQITQRVFGREKQINKLLAAFNQTTQGSTELVLLAGFPGIGKTSIVNEIHKPIIEKRGFFISGKFDQFRANIPYSAFIEAFQDLIQQILTETDDMIAMWRERLKAALGVNARVIMDVIPELRYVIGEKQPSQGFDGQETQNRFNFFFQRFISLYASPESPLVIFLDDLQWVDPASLQLIELILTTLKTKGLLLIGAYRSNEVTPMHPLISATQRIKRTGGSIEEIDVGPLEAKDVNLIIAESLHISPETTKDLCRVVYDKTRGNPFFINQFLTYLFEEGLLFIDTQKGIWSWTIDKIQELDVSENVIELLIVKLKKCSEETQELLEIAACIGNNFDVRMIAKIADKPLNQVTSKLLEAIEEGLILPSDELQSLLWIESKEFSENGGIKTPSKAFKFMHDKVQQAAYQLMNEEKRKTTHYKIGLFLLQKYKDEQLEEHIFDVMAQLNHAADLIREPNERHEYAKMNLLATEKAMRTVAYGTALNFIKVGIAFLPKNHFETDYELSHKLYLLGAEANYLLFNFDEASRLFDLILSYAKTESEKISVYTLKVKLYISSANYKEAIRWSRIGLKMLGINLPTGNFKFHVVKEFFVLQMRMFGKEIDSLATLPVIKNQMQVNIINLLYLLIPPAYLTSKDFFAFIVLKGLTLSLKYGNAPMTPYIYASYGIIQNAIFENFKSSFAYGKLALELIQKFENQEFVPATKFIVGTFLNPTQRHLRTSVDILQTGYEMGTSTGDFINAVFCQGMMVTDKYLTAYNIDELWPEVLECIEYVSRIKSHNRGYVFNTLKQVILALRGETYNPSSMQTDEFNEEAFLQMLRDNNFLITLYFAYTFKMQLCYLFENYEQAIEFGTKTDELTFCVLGQPMRLENDFYFALSMAANYAWKDHPTQKAYKKRIKKILKRLLTWSKAIPANYLHKYLLVKAELARIEGDKETAVECYDEAIESAKENSYTQNEGIANELFAKFYLSQNRGHLAKQYLIDSHYAFYRWGAQAKMMQLETKYHSAFPSLNLKEIQVLESVSKSPGALIDSRKSIDSIDLMAVIKATQTLSGEIVLNRLIDQLMHIVVETAGAQKGALILDKEGNLLVEAEYAPESGDNTTRPQVHYKERKEHLSASVVNYVVRTKEPLVIDEALKHPLFSNDPYIVRNHTQSILCFPLFHQTSMIGILYLENNLTTKAFTPERVEILKLLTAQIATSLENSILYSHQAELSEELRVSNEKLEDYSHNLEKRVYNRTRELNEKNQQLEETLQQIKEMQKKLIQQEKLVSMATVTKGIATEMRNPLNYIQNFATLSEKLLNELKEGNSSQNSREELSLIDTNLKKIQEHSKKADEIITTMIEQSRDSEMLREPTDINKLIRDYADIVYYNYYKKDPLFSLTLETDYDDTIGKIEVVPQNLGRVFYNVIDNACYATDLKKKEVGGNFSPIVSISTKNSEEHVTIVIRDNGSGIPSEILSRVFSPFLTTKPSGKGAGMGLSISHDIIVQDHGGTIDIRSEVGEFTEVTITLPKFIRKEPSPAQLVNKA